MDKKVRVRFAPSPTGPLHIGGVRTALFNYLYAKKYGGDFILRIEDTDQNRYVEGATSYIKEALEWCGIPYDEGPGKEGDYGPYKQSERKHIYQEYAARLIKEEKAYYAFDTAATLDEHRKNHEAIGKTFIYNWHNRLKLDNSLVLSEKEVEDKIASGTPYVIRFKTPENEVVTVHDEIRGEVKVASNTLDDKVLYKSDGMPTYHLANIVDDHLMNITHVIRGEEWLPSLALHFLLYKAFNWQIPKFAHLPLILKPDPKSYINKKTIPHFIGLYTNDFIEDSSYNSEEVEKLVKNILENPKNLNNALKINKEKDATLKQELKLFLKKGLFGKLSKRDGDKIGFPVFPLQWENKNNISKGFREEGYLPEAVINFLVFLGWNPGTAQEIFSLDELVAIFDLKKVNKAGAKFDHEKAKWFNQHYFVAQNDHVVGRAFNKLLKEKGIVSSTEYILKVVALIKERAVFTKDLWELGSCFFVAPVAYEEKALAKTIKENTVSLMHKAVALIEAAPAHTVDTLQHVIKNWISSEAIGFGDVMQPLRLSLVGEMKGPDVFEIMVLLGKEETIKRINRLIA